MHLSTHLSTFARTHLSMHGNTWHAVGAGLNVSEEVKVEMWAVTPQNFTGISL